LKVGDLVKIPECLAACGKPPTKKCGCFHCAQNSNRIGVIITSKLEAPDYPHCVAVFDVGEWAFYPPDVAAGDVEIISENR